MHALRSPNVGLAVLFGELAPSGDDPMRLGPVLGKLLRESRLPPGSIFPVRGIPAQTSASSSPPPTRIPRSRARTLTSSTTSNQSPLGRRGQLGEALRRSRQPAR